MSIISRSSDWMSCLGASRAWASENPTRHADLCKQVAEKLISERRFKEASQVYRCCWDFWVLKLIDLIEYVIENNLTQSRTFTWHGSEYLNDKEEAVSVLVRGCCWGEAELVISYLNRRDLHQTILLPAIQEAHETIKSNLRNQRESFDENFARYTLIVKTRSHKNKQWECVWVN